MKILKKVTVLFLSICIVLFTFFVNMNGIKAEMPNETISISVIQGKDCLDQFTPIYIDGVAVSEGEVTVSQKDNHEIKFQVAFGSSVSAVFVNETEYEITDIGEGQIKVCVPDAASYTIKLIAGVSDDVTIMWSYDSEDADSDYYVDHGKVEVLSITRGLDIIYDDKHESEDVRIDNNGGWVALKTGDDVVLKLIPDYGYQLDSVTINDQDLEPQKDVSVFSLPDIQGNLHFKGVFVKQSDKITDSSNAVSNISIADGQNAVSTGNLSLQVSDNNSYAKDISSAVSGNATKVAAIDISLDNVVSKGNGKSGDAGWWTTNITEFVKPIQVGLKVDSTTLAAGETYGIVRDHNGTLTELENVKYDANTNSLSFETNQFSTYTIVKKTAAHTHSLVTTTTKATTTADGKIETKCTICNVVTETTVIPAAKNISLSAKSYTYNGKTKKPLVTIKDSNGNSIEATNYTVSYAKGSKNVGKYTVEAVLQGNYEGSLSASFTINPLDTSISKLKAGKKAFTVKWSKKTKQVDGYEIQYSTSKTFKGVNKTVKISKNSAVSKGIKELKAKKTYYVRIRTYKTVSKKTYYSAWSASKKITTK